MSSFWKTTLPGVVAMLTPSSKALLSVIEILSWPLPRSMSSSRLFIPFTRFWPPVATVSRNTSGLVSAKFDGASASMYWRVKKSTFFRVCWSRPSTFGDGLVQPARGDEIRLLDVVEQEMLLPVVVAKTLVALGGLRDGRGRLPHQLEHRRLPQRRIVPPQVHLRLGEAGRIGHHLRGQLEERLGQPELVAHDGMRRHALAGEEIAEQLGALVGGARERFGQGDRIAREPCPGLRLCWCSSVNPQAVGCGRERPLEADHSVGADGSRQSPGMPQVIHVGDRLAHGEETLLGIERAAKQHRQHVGCGDRRRRRSLELRQPRRVMRRAIARRAARRRRTAGRATAGSSVAGGRSAYAWSEARKRASGSPSGSTGHTLTLVLILGNSMSPEMHTARSSQYSAACSGEWP